MRVRNLSERSGTVNTRLGETHLDQYGTVLNPSWIKGGVAELVNQRIPGFEDASVFPPDGGYPKGYNPVEEAPPERVETPPYEVRTGPNVIIARPIEMPLPPGDITEDMYWSVIKELSMDVDNLNLKGYVEMDILTANLKVLAFPVLTGTQRIQITDKYRKLEEENAGKPGLPVETE